MTEDTTLTTDKRDDLALVQKYHETPERMSNVDITGPDPGVESPVSERCDTLLKLVDSIVHEVPDKELTAHAAKWAAIRGWLSNMRDHGRDSVDGSYLQAVELELEVYAKALDYIASLVGMKYDGELPDVWANKVKDAIEDNVRKRVITSECECGFLVSRRPDAPWPMSTPEGLPKCVQCGAVDKYKEI